MNEPFDVLVVGGGVIGLSAAIAMRKRCYSVAVMDKGSLNPVNDSKSARVFAVNHASQVLLQELEVWQSLEKKRLAPYRAMHVWDAQTSAHIDFDSRMIGEDYLGVILEELAIKQALLQKAKEMDVVFYPHCAVDAVDEQTDKVMIQSKSGHVAARLLIVADGALSATRSLLNVPVTTWPYHQHAVVATVLCEKPHQNTAYQVFNREGPLAFLPLANQNTCSIVWSTAQAKANWLLNLPDELFNQHLTKAFAAKLGDCCVQSPRFCFPLFMRHVQQYSGRRWLLMGDAAHTIHPLAGLGLNVGLADLNSWIKITEKACHLDSMDKLLKAYQRQRKHAVWQTITLMETLKALFANPLAPIASLRGLGLKLCNNALFLKRFFIFHAAGKGF